MSNRFPSETFQEPKDIINRGLDHLGATHIETLDEESINATKTVPMYNKLRRAELRRNNWLFSIKKAPLRPITLTAYLLDPAEWNAGVQYLPGSIVFHNSQIWVSTEANNLNNEPGDNDIWDTYFGPMTVDAYTSKLTYLAGELVYILNTDGSFNIYMSMSNVNTETPNVADVWNATTTYQQDQTVSFSGSQWRSLIALNLDNPPANPPANWDMNQTYASGNTVTGSDGFIYSSLINGNTGIDPTSDGGTNWSKTGALAAWTSLPKTPVTSTLWVPIYAGLKSLNLVYPLNSGPLNQTSTRNVYRLPAGYLHHVEDDPKQGVSSFLGAPSNRQADDWEFEGKYILSHFISPIIIRFVADIQTVSQMDDMFCEGLGCRIGLEACEAITNSNAKQQTCNNAYKLFMGEARITNAIETGPVQPSEDLYVTVRF